MDRITLEPEIETADGRPEKRSFRFVPRLIATVYDHLIFRYGFGQIEILQFDHDVIARRNLTTCPRGDPDPDLCTSHGGTKFGAQHDFSVANTRVGPLLDRGQVLVAHTDRVDHVGDPDKDWVVFAGSHSGVVLVVDGAYTVIIEREYEISTVVVGLVFVIDLYRYLITVVVQDGIFVLVALHILPDGNVFGGTLEIRNH